MAIFTAAMFGDAAARKASAVEGGRLSWAVRRKHLEKLVCDLPTRLGKASEVSVRDWYRYGAEIGELLLGHIPVGMRGQLSVGKFFSMSKDRLPSPRRHQQNFSTPFLTVEAAYKALVRRADTGDVGELDVLHLAWLGLSVRTIVAMNPCRFCYRWAVPGETFCLQHSQTLTAPGSQSEKAARYRLGKKTASRYHYPPRSPPKYVQYSFDKLPRLLARLLWKSPAPNEEGVVQRIRKVLNSHPQLSAHVGENLSALPGARLYKRLNEIFDPLEFNPVSWAWKLTQAARWIEIERKLAPGKRGKGRRTRIRIAMARSYARMGYTKSEIAYLLEISPSAISNWIARGLCPELEDI